jgi:CRP/FNR family cyclic AMP-dependent transcriptional regulator
MVKSQSELEHVFRDPWFDALGPTVRSAVISEGRQITIGARAFAIRKGDPPNGFYGVIEGMLAASVVLEDGKQMIFGLLEGGDWFGEASSIDGLPRSHDIVALRRVRLLHVPSALFERLMFDARFARAMAVLQSSRTRTMYAFFEDAALHTTRVRLARRLLKLTHGDGPAAPRARKTVPVTQEILSRMLGLTRQTLAIELKALAVAGAVTLSYGRISIESESILRSIGQT